MNTQTDADRMRILWVGEEPQTGGGGGSVCMNIHPSISRYRGNSKATWQDVFTQD